MTGEGGMLAGVRLDFFRIVFKVVLSGGTAPLVAMKWSTRRLTESESLSSEDGSEPCVAGLRPVGVAAGE